MTERRTQQEAKDQPTRSPRSDQAASQTEFHPDNHDLLELQRKIGNRGVQRLLAQRKLTVGAPDDAYEQEADRVAETVMRMPEPLEEEEKLQTKPENIMREALPEEEELMRQEALPEEEEALVQMDAVPGSVPAVDEETESQIEGARGGGQSLPESAREFFEPRFGQDFSGVQVHTSSDSDMLNRDLNARAFTTGQDIFFRSGEYNPESSGGRELLAHELTHVVQQGGSTLQAKDDEHIQRDTLTDQVPQGVTPKSASLSISLPGGKVLAADTEGMIEDWNLATSGTTTVTLQVTPTGINISMSPALAIDAQWPVENMEVSGLFYDFTSGTVTVSAANTGNGLSSRLPQAKISFETTFRNAIKGTRVAAPGYDPMTDPNVTETLEQIATNWQSTPSSGGSVGAGDITKVTASVSVDLKDIHAGTPAGSIHANGNVTISAEFAGSMKDIAEDGSRKIAGVTISGDSIIAEQKGSPVAKIKSLRIEPGGIVNVTSFEAMGPASTLQGVESLGKLFLLLGALSSGRPEDRLAVGNREPHLEPDETHRYIEGQIEQALTQAVQQLIRDNCYSISGVNLGSIFGVAVMGDFPAPPPNSRAG